MKRDQESNAADHCAHLAETMTYILRGVRDDTSLLASMTDSPELRSALDALDRCLAVAISALDAQTRSDEKATTANGASG